ncbi:patatin-like phospholipase domain-containing protein [Ancylobacter lacus]|uniref:hypothetical protein n=1 Tax=Ancylobacter lacus TaxID=2579970 RepID=UPI001BCD3B8E|nr:hypothetical protein [Ancylobacter lacus]MBS7541160.1 hypothetical protein [Ancylobacter lacus]
MAQDDGEAPSAGAAGGGRPGGGAPPAKTGTPDAEGRAATPIAVVEIDAVIAAETESIRRRRHHVAERMRRSKLIGDEERARAACGAVPLSEELGPVLGLAQSGGGIRSAAFCLGALQAMDAVVQAGDTPPPGHGVRPAADETPSVLDRFDYLSTVSGGGYIGASLVAALSLNGGHFPFRSVLDQEETPAVQHLRDHSNYLFPQKVDIYRGVAVYLRGLAVTSALAGCALALLALVLVFYRDALAPLWRVGLPRAGTVLLWVSLAALLVWGLMRSFTRYIDRAEMPVERSGRFFYWALAVGFAVWLDASNRLLDALVVLKSAQWSLGPAIAALAPLSALVAFVGPRLAAALGRMRTDPSRSAALLRAGGHLALWAGAAVLPLLLWVGVLFLALQVVPTLPLKAPAACFTATGVIDVAAAACHPVSPPAWHWLWLGVPAALGVVWLAFEWFAGARWRLGASSLHRLYRDCLSRAFLFCPPPVDAPPGARVTAADTFRLRAGEDGASGIDPARAPYLLMNTAINLQNSRFANTRGRNADFFLFSHDHVGSRATGYARTQDLLAYQPGVDVGTVVAASGAAVSSNMGSNSLAPLTPTLALTNVRLGYWLANPRCLAGLPANGSGHLPRFRLAFLREMFGLLNENQPQVYISDGGHIDNLGLIELLRRRCRLILVLDAEADATFDFTSFMILQRHARIDMGVRIDLPWEAIRAEALKADGRKPGAVGPHVAVGRITYAPPAGPGPCPEGILVYVKSSLTDDESDMIRSYRRRFPGFPHETTLDQLFSEEQFEVYRALGFHILKGLFSGADRVAVAAREPGAYVPDVAQLVEAGLEADHPLLNQVRELLRLPPRPAAGPQGAPPAGGAAGVAAPPAMGV